MEQATINGNGMTYYKLTRVIPPFPTLSIDREDCMMVETRGDEEVRIKCFRVCIVYVSMGHYSYFMHHTFFLAISLFLSLSLSISLVSIVVMCSFFRTSTLLENERKKFSIYATTSDEIKSNDSRKIENIESGAG